MRSFLRTFVLAGITGGLIWGIYYGRGKDLSTAVWSGVIAGILFGLVAAFAVRYRENRVSESGPVLMGEMLLREGRATHDGMSGWLYLTNRRLLFEGYPTDENSPEISTLFERFPADAADDHQVSIPVLQITEIKAGSVPIDSRLSVVLSDGLSLSFGTEGPAEWVDEISMARQKYLDEPRSEEMKLFP